MNPLHNVCGAREDIDRVGLAIKTNEKLVLFEIVCWNNTACVWVCSELYLVFKRKTPNNMLFFFYPIFSFRSFPDWQNEKKFWSSLSLCLKISFLCHDCLWITCMNLSFIVTCSHTYVGNSVDSLAEKYTIQCYDNHRTIKYCINLSGSIFCRSFFFGASGKCFFLRCCCCFLFAVLFHLKYYHRVYVIRFEISFRRGFSCVPQLEVH